MKKLLTVIFSIVSFTAFAAYQAGPMTTNKAAAYATTGQAPVFNGTQWVFVNTNAFGGGTATATNAIANSNGLGTNTSLFGNVGIGTTNPSHTLHVVTGTNNAVGVDSTGTDSSSMFHIHNYAGTQGPFFDFGAPPGRWGFGMSSVGSFNLRFTQDTNTDPVNGTTLVVFSTNGVITGDASGLTNIPGSGLQSPLVIGDMTVSNLTVTNAYLNLANSTNYYASNIVSGGILPIGTVATNAGADGQVLTKTGDSRKWVDPAVIGSATNAIVNVKTNGVAIAVANTIITNLNIQAVDSSIVVTGAVVNGQANIGIQSTASGGGAVAPGYATTVTTNGSTYTVDYDPTDESSVVIDEEFFNTTGTGSIGTYGWTTALGSGTFSGNTASLSGHPGIVNVLSGASGAQGAAIVLGDTGNPTKLQFQDFTNQVPWKMRLIFKVSRTNSCEFEAGLVNENVGSTNLAASGIGIRYQPTVSTNIVLFTGDGAVTTTAIIPAVSNIWYDVIIGSSVGQQVYASANGGAYVTNTTHVPNAVQLIPIFKIYNQGDTVATTMAVDAFKAKFKMPTRYP